MALLRRDPFKEELDYLLAEYRALETTYSERSQRIDSYRDEANRVRDPNLYVQTADLTDYGRRPRADGLPHRHRIPLPLGKATVTEVFIKKGDKVESGQVILIIEAMKMKNSIRSVRTGTVADLLVSAGQTVAHKQALVEFTE